MSNQSESGFDQTGAPGVRRTGPDDVDLLFEPYDDGYVWKIRNRLLKDIEAMSLEIVGVQSFDAEKGAFREPATAFRALWRSIRNLPAGELTKAVIFVAFEGDGLRLGQSLGMNRLPWPSGDPATTHRWLLSLRIIGLPQEWSLELDLHWIAGTKHLQLTEHVPVSSLAPGSSKNESPENLPTAPRRISQAPRAGTILSGHAPAPRPIVITPKINISYAEDIPELIRKRVFRERIRAIDSFDEKKISVKSDSDVEKLQLEVILNLFSVFEKEAFELAATAGWTGERYELECLSVLEQCGSGAGLTRGKRIPADLQMIIEQSEHWKKYRGHLRDIADAQAAESPPGVESTNGMAATGAEVTSDAGGASRLEVHRTIRPHGFEADAKRHKSIADIVGNYDPDCLKKSNRWKQASILKDICAGLDGAEIDIPDSWRRGATPSLKEMKLRDWGDTLQLGHKKLIVDQIRHSLEMARKARGETKDPKSPQRPAPS